MNTQTCSRSACRQNKRQSNVVNRKTAHVKREKDKRKSR